MADNKPASVPSWATDTTFSSGPKSGSPTKVMPSGGALAQGEVPEQPYRAERHNWLWNLLCGWAFYLSDLHNQVQFLNKAYSWTAAHVFGSTVQLASAPTYTTGVSRTSWASMAGAWAQNGSVFYATDVMDAAPVASGFVVMTDPNPTRICIPFRLPPGATLTKATGVVTFGGSYNGIMRIIRRTNSTGGSSRGAVGAQVAVSAVSGVQTIPTATLASVVAETHEYWAEFEFSNVNSAIDGVMLEWTDPGIQNQVR